jgi:hypothetical protein
VVLAVPVAPPGWQAGIGGDADELVCVETPPRFFAIGRYYTDFSQVSDDEVLARLQRSAGNAGPSASGDLYPVAHAQPGLDLRQMRFNRPERHEKLGADLLVGATDSHQPRHSQFTFRQRRPWRLPIGG